MTTVKLTPFFALLFMLLSLSAVAQTPEEKKARKIDSLRRMLVLAKHDTDKIRLRYQLGKTLVIKRISYWDSLLADARKSKHAFYEIKGLLGLGFSYQQKYDYKMAAVYLGQARRIAIEKGYKQEHLAVLSYLASCYQESPQSKDLLDLNYEGLRLAEELNNPKEMSKYYTAIGDCYFFAESLPEALSMYEKSLQLSREIRNNLGIMKSLLNIGSIYHAMRDTLNTNRYYLQSLKYVDEFKETKHAGVVYYSVAATFNNIKQFDSSIQYCEKAMAISLRYGDYYGYCSSQATLADSYCKKGDIKRALMIIEKTMALADSIKYYVELPELYLLRKNIYRKEHKYKEALADYERYIVIRDSLSNEKVRKRGLQKEFDYNLEKKENENNLLAQKNQIQQLQLSQNRYFFWGLGGLVLLVAVIGWLLLRQNKLRAQQQNIRLEQKLLYSQMNPHFIFNSLNSIQHFVLTSENDKAELYLSKFAKLIRELLESSTAESISLQEEVSVLTGYIEMEALRFSNSFNYSIEVDEKIDPLHTRIPHMLIQPFIENAIWHGLLAKSSDRNLVVAFKAESKGMIRCEIEDNGVGRDASSKTSGRFKKKSLALGFVQQRLKLMRSTFKVNCNVEIIDKKNNAGESLGTKIVVLLPILPTEKI